MEKQEKLRKEKQAKKAEKKANKKKASDDSDDEQWKGMDAKAHAAGSDHGSRGGIDGGECRSTYATQTLARHTPREGLSGKRRSVSMSQGLAPRAAASTIGGIDDGGW